MRMGKFSFRRRLNYRTHLVINPTRPILHVAPLQNRSSACVRRFRTGMHPTCNNSQSGETNINAQGGEELSPSHIPSTNTQTPRWYSNRGGHPRTVLTQRHGVREIISCIHCKVDSHTKEVHAHRSVAQSK